MLGFLTRNTKVLFHLQSIAYVTYDARATSCIMMILVVLNNKVYVQMRKLTME